MAPKASRGSSERGLSEYRRRRDPKSTPEPAAADGAAGGGEPGNRFVIQQHSARRLHWDLRLEHDEALASWALPKGLPERTDRNNKAIRTEDHPLSYLEFEGEIPRGQYGAGTMEIWDRGTFECEKFRPDEVIVTLQGERASGRFALFQAGKSDKDWLIHRMDEPAERGEPMPQDLQPMMARLAKRLPEDETGWAFEIKWDGVRAIAYATPGELRLQSRNLKDITARYPELRRLSRVLGARSAVLDGEIVAFEDGRPSFERLQRRMHVIDEAQVRRLSKSDPVSFQIFDLLHLEGRSLLEEPYEERRRLLEGLELEGEAWQTPGNHRGDGSALLARTAELGLEGIVAKRLTSAYRPGSRSGDWLKLKNALRQEFVIGGWLPQKGRATELGALLVGHHADGELRFAGKVGTGFSREESRSLVERLSSLAREGSPFAGRQPQKGARFVEPSLVAEVEYGSMTREGMLRHPSYKGLRSDREPEQVVLERAEDPEAAPFDVAALESGRRGVRVEVDGRELKLTNLDKVLYPKAGFSKRDVIDYHARIAATLAPHLKGRPLTLKRYPDGVEGRHFFEKKCPSHRPDWIETAELPSERRGTIRHCLVDDLPGLVWLANLADLELHPSLSRAEAIDRPTVIAFDLDPGPGTDLLDCCEVGAWIRGMLERLGMESFPKVSGRKGLHLFVPLNGTATYEETKPFARQVAETLEQRFPDRVTANMAKSRRRGRVLVDWSQNDRHKTTLAPYSLRATERPQVSVPLGWDELERALEERDPASLVFGPEEALDRVAERGDLFAPVLSLVQELPG